MHRSTVIFLCPLGGDLFRLHKIYFPINVRNIHWILGLVDMKAKTIQVYDSLGRDRREYVDYIWEYLSEEHATKQLKPLKRGNWRFLDQPMETPLQGNGDDCGVFVCMYSYFLSLELPFTFNQTHMETIRKLIILSLVQGEIE